MAAVAATIIEDVPMRPEGPEVIACRVVESGSHDQLMALGGRYADLFTLQASAYLTSG